MDEYTYNKLPDYIKKCNDHKHKKEKNRETEKLNKKYKEELIRLEEELKESSEANKIFQDKIEQYEKIMSMKDIELLSLDEQNQKLQEKIVLLKDIKMNILEDKLNKTIDMLNNMTDYLVENRILARRTAKLIDGNDISDEELVFERKKLESKK